MSGRFDAVVVGAGPAGSATAIWLARAGWRVALVERQRFPRRKVCGECIAASNVDLLDDLGVGRVFRDRGGDELRRVALLNGRSWIEADLPRGDGDGFGRALGREALDAALVEAAVAAGVDVRQPYDVRDVAGTPGDWRLTLRPAGERLADAQTPGEGTARSPAGEGASVDERGLQAALVVAAHGSWEPLPSERASTPMPRRPGDLFAFKANFARTRLERGLLPVLSFDGGYGGMVVEGDGRATIACCVRRDRLDRAREARAGERAGDVVEALLRREIAGVAQALDGAHREGPWLASGPLRPGLRLGAVDGWFRVGNAAGEAHPIVGEGISMALQSAALLVSTIGAHRAALTGGGAAQRAAIARYEALWRRRFARRLHVAALFAQAAMRPRVSPLLVALLRRWPALLTHGAVWSGKTRAAEEARRLVAAAAC